MHGRPGASPPIDLTGPYRTRAIRWLRRAELDGWTVKVYGISAHSEKPAPELIEAGEAIAGRVLSALVSSRPPAGKGASGRDRHPVLDGGYGVATLIVHEARDGNFLLVSWWTGENMLRQSVHYAHPETPTTFEDIGETGIVACVWELVVLSFERDAWVECVLAAPEPDVEAYLRRTFDADI